MMAFPLRILALAILAVTFSGCAFTYIDDDGYVNSIGFSRVRYRPAAADTVANVDVDTAATIEIETLGLALSRFPHGGALTVGYAAERVAAIPSTASVSMGLPYASIAQQPAE